MMASNPTGVTPVGRTFRIWKLPVLGCYRRRSAVLVIRYRKL